MNRDVSLDVLRGLMLIIMAADHFGEPVFQQLYEFAGYVSAAEGFVLLSGLLVALVYGRYYVRGGITLEHKVWHRAGTIYWYHLVVLIAVFAFSILTELSGASWKSFATEMQTEPVRALVSGILLTYQPPLLDILPMYVVFMLLAPFGLRLMLQYQTLGVAMVLAISAGIWSIATTDAVMHQWRNIFPSHLFIQGGAFNWLAWQFLFVSGMVLGYLRFSHATATWCPNPVVFVLSIGAIVFLYLQRHGQIQANGDALLTWLQQYQHINRDALGWLRLLNVFAFVYVIASVLHYGRNVKRVLGLTLFTRWLAFLGQHSLQVFAYHLVVLYCYIPFRWGDMAFTDQQKWGVLVLFLASLSVPAWLHAQHLQRKKQMKPQAIQPSMPLVYAPAALV